jgi:diacylglycerol kinase family enzyme
MLAVVAVSLIVNPFASGVSEERVRDLDRRLEVVETLLTERRGHATELAAGAAGDAVFVFGGDGVVNEALNGLPPGKPLGIVPGGHSNVLARALGVPKDPAAAVVPRRISLGRVNGRRFAFAAGIGVDADAVRVLETHGRGRDGRRRGDLAYARVIAGRLLRGYEPRLEIEGIGRAGMLFVSNSSVYTYAGPLALRHSSSGSTSARQGASVSRRCRGCWRGSQPAEASPARPASSPPTTSTGSTCCATGRCRCRPTARTSATSRRRSSRPSGARSRC